MEIECKICNDTGEVPSRMRVYANQNHQAYIGTEPCICQYEEDECGYDQIDN